MHKIIYMFCFLSGSLIAQTADEILNKHFEKTGGHKAWNQLNSIYIEGSVQMGLNDAVPVKIFQQRPNYKKIVFQQGGQYVLSEGFDGEKAYTYSQKLNKNIQLPVYQPDAFETDYFKYKGKGFDLVKKKDTVINNEPVFHLELIKNQMRDQLFFSKENYALIQEENEIEVIQYKKNKKFKGLEFSTEIETTTKGGVPYVLRIKEVYPNYAIPENTFKF